MKSVISKEGNTYPIRNSISSQIPDNVDYSILRDYQVADATTILSYTNGLVQLPTGYGKTYLMSWLCDYLPKPILITEPTLALCDEIRSRIGESRMDNIYIVNPTAYWARIERDDSWIESIRTILSDEMMSVTDSIKKFFDRMPHLIRIYGFSATPDRYVNTRLQFIKDHKLHDDTCEILQYYGPAIVYSKMRKSITIYEDELHLGSCGWSMAQYDHWKYKKANDKCFNAKCLPGYIKDCIRRSTGPILFPFTDHKQIEWIFNSPELSEYRIALWDSESVRLNNGKEFTKSHPWIRKSDGEKFDPYRLVKYMIENNQVQVIFTSSVGFKGVDFPTLRNLILMVGSNAGNIIQIVGRVCRSNDPIIFLPKNLDKNDLYTVSYNKRLNWIKSVSE